MRTLASTLDDISIKHISKSYSFCTLSVYLRVWLLLVTVGTGVRKHTKFGLNKKDWPFQREIDEAILP